MLIRHLSEWMHESIKASLYRKALTGLYSTQFNDEELQKHVKVTRLCSRTVGAIESTVNFRFSKTGRLASSLNVKGWVSLQN